MAELISSGKYDEQAAEAGPLARSDPSALRIAVYLGCASLLLALIAFNFVDVDLWHQMALIRESLAAGHLLTHDPYAYTPTISPIIDHEWGAGVLAFFLSRWVGGAGILWLKFAAAFGTLFLVLRIAERGAAASTLSFLVPPGIALLYLAFLPAVRAHAYSLLFTAFLLWVLERDRQGDRRWLLAWLAIFPIWVNLHAGFIVGMGFVLLYALERAISRRPYRHALGVLCVMLLEVFANPYGPGYFSYLAKAWTMSRPRIPEWRPLWTLGWPLTVAFGAAMLLFLYSIAKSQSWRLPGVLLITASGLEALRHRKLLPFFAVTWICYVPSYFHRTPAGQWLGQFARRRTGFLIVCWGVTIAACLAAAVQQKFWRVEVPQVKGEASYPVGAVDYLAAQKFHGNLMVPFRAGAYASWKLYPSVKVSVDSRYEVAYPETWVEQTFRFYGAGDDWRETLDAYGTDLALVPKAAPVRPLIQQSGWMAVYVDDEFELYAKPGIQLPTLDATGRTIRGTFP
jgi:hypothetical protein